MRALAACAPSHFSLALLRLLCCEWRSHLRPANVGDIKRWRFGRIVGGSEGERGRGVELGEGEGRGL